MGIQPRTLPAEVWTSRYHNPRLKLDVPAGKVVPVHHVLYKPKYPTGFQIEEEVQLLAPPRSIFRNAPYDRFREVYLAHVRANQDKIVEAVHAIERKHPGKPLVFLCFENLAKPGEWCHRRIFAEWWESDVSGYPVKEYPEVAEVLDLEAESKKRRDAANDLFCCPHSSVKVEPRTNREKWEDEVYDGKRMPIEPSVCKHEPDESGFCWFCGTVPPANKPAPKPPPLAAQTQKTMEDWF